MKKVVIIATGGTIAGIGKSGMASEYEAGQISISQITDSIPSLASLADISAIQLMNIDSNEMTISRWIELKKMVEEVLRTADGVVITHGTDTLDETAYFLTLTLHTYKPVVLTGAMRPASATSADGPYNLYQAVSLAASEEAKGKGVLALFSNTIYSGRDIQKENNYRIDAFGQRSLGCLGYMQDEKIYFFSSNNKKHTADSIFSWDVMSELPSVAIAYFHIGADPELLYFMAERNKGIVVAGSGSGNFNEEWQKAIRELSAKGIVFVRSSRISQGIILESQAFDPDNLCIPSNTLSPQKARVLLSLALTKTNNPEMIRQIFVEY